MTGSSRNSHTGPKKGECLASSRIDKEDNVARGKEHRSCRAREATRSLKSQGQCGVFAGVERREGRRGGIRDIH